jgi:hypothetical protein
MPKREGGGGFEKRPGKLLEATVDLSGGWDSQSYRDILFDSLRKLGIYRPDALYHGNVAYGLEALKNSIAAGSRISCSTEQEMSEGIDPLTYALDRVGYEGEEPVIVVLKPESLEQAAEADSTQYAYRLKAGSTFEDAVIAVLRLKD